LFERTVRHGRGHLGRRTSHGLQTISERDGSESTWHGPDQCLPERRLAAENRAPPLILTPLESRVNRFAFCSRLGKNRTTERRTRIFVKATIYHNPACGTSRKTLEILRESGADVWVREYLKQPPERGELERLYERAGITARGGLRAKEPLAAELGLNRDDVTNDMVLDAMLAHPILIERPLVETAKGVRLCRPQDKVREIL